MENNEKNIVLTGFMGTGKTTLGRIISEKTGRSFFDTDDMVEGYCHMNIREIFAICGEEYFREVERKMISQVSMNNGCIIACGGGAVKYKENMDALSRNSTIVCLKADAKTIISRVGDDYGRPLIFGLSVNKVQKLLEEREPYYNMADLFVDTSCDTPEALSQKIIELCSI